MWYINKCSTVSKLFNMECVFMSICVCVLIQAPGRYQETIDIKLLLSAFYFDWLYWHIFDNDISGAKKMFFILVYYFSLDYWGWFIINHPKYFSYIINLIGRYERNISQHFAGVWSTIGSGYYRYLRRTDETIISGLFGTSTQKPH